MVVLLPFSIAPARRSIGSLTIGHAVATETLSVPKRATVTTSVTDAA